jgi:hypothetical protein
MEKINITKVYNRLSATEINIKWIIADSYSGQDIVCYTGSRLRKDKTGICFYVERDEIEYIHECKEVYWLDETPEDWNLLEKQFNEDFNTLTDKPTTGYDVVQWIKEKLRATN